MRTKHAGRHRLGTPGLVHCLVHRSVALAVGERRRGWLAALLIPAKHSLAGLHPEGPRRRPRTRLGAGHPVTPAELRDACLAQPGAVEEFPFPRYPERSVFKISSLGDEPLRVSLKCEPDLALRLRDEHPAIQPGYRTARSPTR